MMSSSRSHDNSTSGAKRGWSPDVLVILDKSSFRIREKRLIEEENLSSSMRPELSEMLIHSRVAFCFSKWPSS